MTAQCHFFLLALTKYKTLIKTAYSKGTTLGGWLPCLLIYWQNINKGMNYKYLYILLPRTLRWESEPGFFHSSTTNVPWDLGKLTPTL